MMKAMKMTGKVDRAWIFTICSAALVLGTTIGFGAVNSTTVTLIPIGRTLALSVAVASLSLYLVSGSLYRSVLIGLWLFSLLLLYGALRGISLAGSLYSPIDYAISATIIALGVICFSMVQQQGLQDKSARILVVFFWIWTVVLILSTGLSISFPPRYNYELYSENGNLLTSSQALTKFFGIASLLALSLALSSTTTLNRVLFYFSVTIFSLLSFLAASRGEFAFLILCMALLYSSGSIRRKMMAALLVYIGFLVLLWGMQNLSNDFAAFSRYRTLILEGDLSYRDLLFSESISLLLDNPKCLFFGCGFAYFQHYYGYDYGLYPHNSILEAIITWGMPLSFAVFSLIMLGARGVKWSMPFPQIGLFSLLISLKSGDLMGGWLAMSFAFYLAGRGLSSVTMIRK